MSRFALVHLPMQARYLIFNLGRLDVMPAVVSVFKPESSPRQTQVQAQRLFLMPFLSGISASNRSLLARRDHPLG